MFPSPDLRVSLLVVLIARLPAARESGPRKAPNLANLRGVPPRDG